MQNCGPDEQREAVTKLIGKNIRDVRLRKKITQERLADLAGINPKYLGEIERGEKSPTAVVVQRIVVALETPLCSILSANGCPCSDSGLPDMISELLAGKEAEQMKKAMKILTVFFE